MGESYERPIHICMFMFRCCLDCVLKVWPTQWRKRLQLPTTYYLPIVYQPTPRTTRSARPRARSHDTPIPKGGQPNTTHHNVTNSSYPNVCTENGSHIGCTQLTSVRSCTQEPLFGIGMNPSQCGSYTSNCFSDCEILIV